MRQGAWDMQFEWLEQENQDNQENTSQVEWVKFELTKDEKSAFNTVCQSFLASRASSAYEALPHPDARILGDLLLTSSKQEISYKITAPKEYLPIIEKYAESFTEEFGADFPEAAIAAQGIAKAINDELVTHEFQALLETATPEHIIRQE